MHALDTAPFWVRALSGAASAGLTWLVAADLGGAAIRKLAPGLVARALLGAALGYVLVGSAIGALALFHALDVRIIAALFVVAIVARRRTYWRVARESGWRIAAGWHLLRDASLLKKSAITVTVIGFGIAFCAAALPAVWWDPIAYHLPVVALGLAHRTLAFDAGMAQTGFPLLSESAALPAYALAGTAGAALATLGAGIVLALLCGALAESVAQCAGALATALVATSALWLWLAPSFYIDVPFALFAVAAIAVPFLGRKGDETKNESKKNGPKGPLLQGPLTHWSSGLLSGAFAGAAAATKYPGLFLAFIALAFVLWANPRRMSQVASFVTGFALIALGWYARTFVLTGDPIYPFLGVVLAHVRASHAAASGQNVVQWFHSAIPHFCGGGIAASDLVLLPWRMLTDPKMFCGDPGYALRLGFVLFVAAPFIFRPLRPLVLVACALTGFWFYTAQQWRFLVAALSLFAVVVAAATMLTRTRSRMLVAALVVALCYFGALTEVMPSLIAEASNSLVPAYRYMAGGKSGQDYLRDRLESYAAAQWLAQHDKDAKIFALDDVRDYYFGTNVAWGNSPYPGGWRLNWSDTSQQRYHKLIAAGYRYMVVNDNPAYTHRTLTDVDWPALERDEQAGVLRSVFSENYVTVYQFNLAQPSRE